MVSMTTITSMKATTTAIRTKDTVQAPNAVIARPKAVAIHGFMDCHVAIAPRSDGNVERRSGGHVARLGDGTIARRCDGKRVIARPKAVAIHGFMDCHVAVAPRSDGNVARCSDGTFSRRSDEIGAPHA